MLSVTMVNVVASLWRSDQTPTNLKGAVQQRLRSIRFLDDKGPLGIYEWEVEVAVGQGGGDEFKPRWKLQLDG